LSSRAKEKFKRDREDENDPVVQPELRSDARDCTALSAAEGLVTEPMLTVARGGEEFSFMADTGAMVSLIQPGISKAQVQSCNVQARGITGTQLDILGEQEVKFKLQSDNGYMVFVHKFVVTPLNRCSSGILDMDFLQRVGAEISLTSSLLCIGHYSFPLKGQEPEFSEVRQMATAEQPDSRCIDEEARVEPVGDWEGTVELAETVTVPQLSVRIAQCRVIRRDGPVVDRVPRNEAVLIDPEGLPGIYIARIVATLDCGNMSSSDASGSDMPVVEKSSLVNINIKRPPSEKCVVGSDGIMLVTSCDNGFLNVGSGECLPELPESGAPVAATCHGDDLQEVNGSHPVENRNGKQVDTPQNYAAQKEMKGIRGQNESNEIENQISTKWKQRNIQRKTQVLGYVPIQAVNLSLEEVKLEKRMFVGIASPIQVNETQEIEGYNVNAVAQGKAISQDSFDMYLRDKLAHLKGEDSHIIRCVTTVPTFVLWITSKELGCTSQVEHSIETGDARPIKRNPYRIPHALKPVVDEHIDDMLDKGIIEPSTSPWSSSIVLVQKKSRDGIIKYRFCIDY
jgi:hypothetical protein